MTENTVIKKLFQEADGDLQLTYSNLKQKSQISSQLRLKWYSILFSYKTKLTAEKSKLEQTVQDEVNKLTSSMEFSHLPKQKIELDVKRNNENVKAIAASISSIEEIISFLGPVVDIFNDFGFTVKNSIEAAKLDILK